MTAETIAKALDGRRTGVEWTARSPAHDDRKPSLTIRDADRGKVLVRCHAGCDQSDVIAALRARGIWEGGGRHNTRWRRKNARLLPSEAHTDSVKRTQKTALAVSPPRSIRFHTGLKHPSGSVWPAMVALVTCGVDGKPIGIHRTFIAGDGNGKAPVDPAKMMLGPCRGGAVLIAERGVQMPVVYDEHGNVLDGHQRVEICGELGNTERPRLIRCAEVFAL